MTRNCNTMLRLFLTLSLVFIGGSEGFTLNKTSPRKTLLKSSYNNPNRKTSTTSLEQASVAPSFDEQPAKSILQGIRSRLPGRDGGVKTKTTEEEVKGRSFLERHPFMSAVLITTVNAFAADLLTQLVFERAVWNVKRSSLFAAFGFIYQGCAQYAIVNWGWERLFPGTKPRAVLAKIFGMNLLSDPLLFMPTFYIFKEFMVSGSLSFGVVKAALLSYKANALLDWRNSWMVWFPGHGVTYGVMPPHKRIPWMAFLSFFYMCVLSLTRGGAV